MKMSRPGRGRSRVLIIITAALFAAVIFSVTGYVLFPVLFLPSYSKPSYKTETDDEDRIRIVEEARDITVFHDEEEIWELPEEVRAQDFLYEDIDRDGRKELVILCWKRGRYGKHKPTWVKRDEIRWSQHIFIFETEDSTVRPKWMASDIGMDARSFDYEDGMIVITDTDGEVTRWKWISWGLEKM